MKESTRRAVIFAVIVIGGSVMIIFDLPTFYLVLGIVILGILLLFLTGAIKIPAIKLARKPRAKKTASGKEPVAPSPKIKEKKPKKEKTKGQDTVSGGSFSQAFSMLKLDLRRLFRSSKEKTTQTKKIDELLEKSIKGEEVSSLATIVPELAPPQKKGISDPFSELVKDPLNPDMINDLPLDEDIPLANEMDLGDDFSGEISSETEDNFDLSHLDIEIGENESSIAIDEEEDDEVADILAAHQDMLSEEEGSGVDPFTSGLDGLGDIDLGEVDLDQDIGQAGTGQAGGDRPAPAASPAVVSAVASPSPAPSPMPVVSGGGPGGRSDSNEYDMVSFGTGHREDDDLMASLKSDAKGVKRQNNLSLLRDLKDVRVPASDLEKELEGIVRSKKQRD
ncbi:hypothetical protein J2741_000449 [Methanolinea mesophila]|uniref:hypothetical protein n=1 Tax=Methanolinea mesophila TaxID=547055 RepID=UPI001AE20A5D|nr:hypothetical protein [Methanolinea mesophila]MBP1927902.1 hypothetical protein [Methanolinea mesophila]